MLVCRVGFASTIVTLFNGVNEKQRVVVIETREHDNFITLKL